MDPLRRASSWALRRCDLVIVVGSCMKTRLLGRGVHAERPVRVRADLDARAAIEIAETVLVKPIAPDYGTLRSATPLPGAVARPAGERKRS